jgi:uncharacterized protein YgbK (DUF1537 family)
VPERIFIVADDLTGACDSAAAFAANDRIVRVFPDTRNAGLIAGDKAEVIAVTTESRDLGPEEAAICVFGVIERLILSAADGLLFKKIDSAARGPFAAEIEAALGASGAVLALVTPAFPEAGRTILDGVLSVCDLSGQDTQIALRELFSSDTARVSVLPISSEAGLREGIMHALESEVSILLCDAVEQADLDRLAMTALCIPERILWAGSAGLTRALAGQLVAAGPSSSPQVSTQISRRAGRAVLFTGTSHPVTVLQTAYLEQVSGNDGPHPRGIHRVAGSGASSKEVVAAFLSESPAGLILTGGDTAASVLRALQARAIRLAGEIAPGIPWGIVEGGVADGCTVITKSGGFGERDALVRAFEFCESEVLVTR